MDLGPDSDEQILALMASGGTMHTIRAALLASGCPEVSASTVARRMAALRPRLAEARVERREAVAGPVAPALPPALPRTPEEIPAKSSLEELVALRDPLRVALADASGDPKLVASTIRVITALEDTISRRTPRPAPDPNLSPDMVALGGEVAARHHAMIEMLVNG